MVILRLLDPGTHLGSFWGDYYEPHVSVAEYRNYDTIFIDELAKIDFNWKLWANKKINLEIWSLFSY